MLIRMLCTIADLTRKFTSRSTPRWHESMFIWAIATVATVATLDQSSSSKLDV